MAVTCRFKNLPEWIALTSESPLPLEMKPSQGVLRKAHCLRRVSHTSPYTNAMVFCFGTDRKTFYPFRLPRDVTGEGLVMVQNRHLDSMQQISTHLLCTWHRLPTQLDWRRCMMMTMM